MKLLLTSNGLTNQSLHRALVELLGKPIAEANALMIVTGMYPFVGGPGYAWKALAGKSHNAFGELGWKSFGNLELSVLPSIDRDVWAPTVAAADAILVWGGDPLFLAHWMRESGLASAIAPHAVYVGTSAGAMVASATIGETYTNPRRARGEPLSSEPIVLPDGEIARTFVTARGMGWVDFSLIPHYRAKDHPDASETNARVWASKLPVPTYAIDDATAIKVTDRGVEVVSEGQWKLFSPA
ncbi:MAG TPA: Type 1 glutamine amidotransferase-like domain-containing protein [Kofleriaceae bacterium]